MGLLRREALGKRMASFETLVLLNLCGRAGEVLLLLRSDAMRVVLQCKQDSGPSGARQTVRRHPKEGPIFERAERSSSRKLFIHSQPGPY